MQANTIIGVIAIYVSVAIPMFAYFVQIERRLTRIETMLNNYVCPLRGEQHESD